MTTKEKLAFISKMLEVKPDTLSEETELNALRAWDSLTILNLQIELTAIRPDLQFDDLYSCNTIGDICKMF